MKTRIFIITLITITGLLFSPLARADELQDIQKQLNDLNAALENSKKATAPLEEDLVSMRKQLDGIRAQITNIESDIDEKEKQISKAEQALAKQKEIIDERINDHYKNIKKAEASLLDILVSPDLSTSLQEFFYQKKAADRDKEAVLRIILYIKNIDDQKKQLADEQSRLASVKQSVDEQSAFLQGEVDEAKSFQADLQKEIAELSARQQSIINSRSGSFVANIGDSELADDYNASIKGFRESAPGGYFGVFSFGAYTHRKGMSQYGAYGRANDGQNYKDILRAYYGKDPNSRDTGGTIRVAGYGELDFESTYLYGIAEMPSSWHPEALKAQAIAARTYAVRYKDEGSEICTTESCQVFRKDKSDNPPEAWRKAVDETRGEVLDGVVTFYSSTSGGFLTTSGWDTKDGNGGSNFVEKTWESIAGSPWVYKAWYTKSYSKNSDKCGRANPWLSPQEMADIVNATLVLTKGTTEEVERISPITTSCWDGNPYSMDELKNVASKYGGIDSANSVSVSQGNGVTNTVNINGVSLNGSDFKKAFNLRAPGHLSIPQSGFAFFNIEKK